MNTHKNILQLSCIAGLACALSFTSCTPMQQQGAQVGGLAGAALGALAGDDSSSVVKGAAIGAAVGAGAAAVREQSQQNSGYYNTGGDIYPQSTSNTVATPTASNYPYATATQNPGYVRSPYKPYNTIDVRGIPSGKMAKEPGTNNIFMIP